jgi:hypothetical protein
MCTTRLPWKPEIFFSSKLLPYPNEAENKKVFTIRASKKHEAIYANAII